MIDVYEMYNFHLSLHVFIFQFNSMKFFHLKIPKLFCEKSNMNLFSKISLSIRFDLNSYIFHSKA